MITIDWVLIVALAYAGIMLLLFAALRVSGEENDAADRALTAMLRQQRSARLRPTTRTPLVVGPRRADLLA